MEVFFKNILAILYQYYNQGATKSIAYNYTLSGLLIVIYLNIMTIAVMLDFKLIYLEDKSRIYKYIVFFVIFAPVFLTLRKKYPEKEIEKHQPNLNYKLFIFLFFMYVIFSFILFVIAVKNK